MSIQLSHPNLPIMESMNKKMKILDWVKTKEMKEFHSLIIITIFLIIFLITKPFRIIRINLGRWGWNVIWIWTRVGHLQLISPKMHTVKMRRRVTKINTMIIIKKNKLMTYSNNLSSRKNQWIQNRFPILSKARR